MKQFFAVVLAIGMFAPSAFASKGAPLCDKNPEAPQCKQSRAKVPADLPERYLISYLIQHAQTAFTAKTGEAAGEATCATVDSSTVAFKCAFVSSTGRACSIVFPQVWFNVDYKVACQGGVSFSALVNPGRIPDTHD